MRTSKVAAAAERQRVRRITKNMQLKEEKIKKEVSEKAKVFKENIPIYINVKILIEQKNIAKFN